MQSTIYGGSHLADQDVHARKKEERALRVTEDGKENPIKKSFWQTDGVFDSGLGEKKGQIKPEVILPRSASHRGLGYTVRES